MKVLGFVGSPKKEGNTKVLVETILKGASDAGAETEIFNLNEANIMPCQSCYACKGNDGKCVLKDDMQKFYEKIDQADAFVLGSPVYMWQMTAQTKLFTDRLFAVFKMGQTHKAKLILGYTCGNESSNLFSSYFDYTKNMFDFLGFKVSDVICADNTGNKPVKDNQEIIEKALNTGKKLASA
ncbi:MAG: NADPH-dependent FMN reductase [Spirochaetes bacterium GWD1_27_9]|nr:MAG: NADPH-dependent FMN reductase [Spirochaetes bacterium GWB1_27_13]OHD28281.1 MAG: NADPH-dependent FMN reductase [Spirochaetes bacterium GWC1_27_15]OHD35048.1 MAG: NADPH-dependent FMN reductase [Spirochaetes bacterium GWD1_27_9]